MEDIAVVRQYLGGAKAIGTPESDLDFVDIIRTGFPVSVFAALCARAGLSEDTVVKSLGIAPRTAARRKREGGRLKPTESELLLRLARVLAAGTDVFGSEEKCRDWLAAPNRALGGREPIALLDAEFLQAARHGKNLVAQSAVRPGLPTVEDGVHAVGTLVRTQLDEIADHALVRRWNAGIVMHLLRSSGAAGSSAQARSRNAPWARASRAESSFASAMLSAERPE